MALITILLMGFSTFTHFHPLLMPDEAETGKLLIEIDNVKKSMGIIWIGIYDSNNYMINPR